MSYFPRLISGVSTFMRKGQITMSTVVLVKCSAVALLLLTLISYLSAIDIESANEGPCMEAPKTVPLDFSWMMSANTWYYPLMSRLDLYLHAITISGKGPKDVSEDELYYDGCIRFDIEGAAFAGYGFNGMKQAFSVKPTADGDAHETYTQDGSYFSTCYTTLTDNKTFIFATCCTAQNQRTWAVNTPLKKLPENTVELTKEHAKSLGFKYQFFTGIRYDHCDDKKDNGKTEL